MAGSLTSERVDPEAQNVNGPEDPRPNPEVRLRPAVTRLVGAPPPPSALQHLPPDQIELYVRAAIHQDRTPGNILAVCHPGRIYKMPRSLFDALQAAGFNVVRVDTQANRLRSVQGIRDALLDLSRDGKPIDLLVVSGDGSLDHHVMVAAYWAFYPELVSYREGEVNCGQVTEADLAEIPPAYREAFFGTLPDPSSLDPSEDTVRQIWLLRAKLEQDLLKQRSVATILRRSRRHAEDLLLRIAILALYFPDAVVLRPHGFDLSGLADAPLESTFQGLYPFLRSIAVYPAGTAADNAVFAGVPGWGYGLVARLLSRLRWLNPLRRSLERRVTKAFMSYFVGNAVVVPARVSVFGLDGAWQGISSHAAGGPGAGRLFSADLTAKTKGLLGYLKRIPAAVIREGLFGSTIVRIRSRYASGEQKSFTEAQISEGLYTNRTFLGGVGSIPTTDPTSFAGQSSLCVAPPIWQRKSDGGPPSVSFRGLWTLIEAIAKGITARLMHWAGLRVGTLAGGGRFAALQPEYQVAIKEGEKIEVDYMAMDKRPRAVPIQVSGDPFQAHRLEIRVAWGPIPLLAGETSLLLASTRRALANLRVAQSFRLRGVYIGGVYYFYHGMGEEWTSAFLERTGLLLPPRHLPGNLIRAQRQLLEAWQTSGAGEFVDTTESGLSLSRRGRYAHNNDQSAHLLLLKEPGGTLLVRQVRADDSPDADIYEARTYYRRVGGSHIVHRSQTLVWQGNEVPKLLQEEHFFRDAEAFQQEAPTFFPVVAKSPGMPTLRPGQDLKPEV